MIVVLRKLQSVLRLAAHAYRHRGAYATAWDGAKAFAFRLASVASGRRRLSRGRSTIKLRVPPLRVAFRRASCDFLLIRDIFEEGEYAPAASWPLPDDAVVFDLGANIGFATIYFSSIRPRARFILVEPDESNIALLRENLAPLLANRQATIHAGFAAARDGTAGISREGEYWEFRKTEAIDPSGERLECFSVPTLLSAAGATRIDLLKCDIEGSEAELFRNCGEWIGKVRHLIVETHLPYRPADLYADLRIAGWTFEMVEERPAGPHWLCFLRHLPNVASCSGYGVSLQ